MNHLIEHKEIVIAVLVAVINLVNALTDHHSSSSGLKKVALWFVEMISVTQSRDADGWLKVPLRSVAPVRPPKVEERNSHQLIVGDKTNDKPE